MKSFIDKYFYFFPNIIYGVLFLVVGFILKSFIKKALRKALVKFKLDKTVESFFVSLLDSLILVVIVAISLGFLGVSTGTMVAILGTLGVAIGLALKDSLSNLAGGFFIIFAKPFSVGDKIEIDDSTGIVSQVTILYTILETEDEKSVYVPNGKVSTIKIIKHN